jgi:serine/threonine protein kinase
MPLAAGTHVGPYEILSAIGAGGMGEVYKARDTRLDRTVALKLIAPLVADDALFRSRFEREARMASALDHPNVCPIYDVGLDSSGLSSSCPSSTERRSRRVSRTSAFPLRTR